jgi:hypothetical protein
MVISKKISTLGRVLNLTQQNIHGSGNLGTVYRSTNT